MTRTGWPAFGTAGRTIEDVADAIVLLAEGDIGEIPEWHQSFTSDGVEETPFSLKLGLPPHLVAGSAMRVEIMLGDAGPAALEDIGVRLALGGASFDRHFSHLPHNSQRAASGRRPARARP